MALGIETATLVGLLLGVACLIVVGLIVLAPWQLVRDEPPLPDDIETRLLLGEDPARIAEEEDEGDTWRRRQPVDHRVVDLDRNRRTPA